MRQFLVEVCSPDHDSNLEPLASNAEASPVELPSPLDTLHTHICLDFQFGSTVPKEKSLKKEHSCPMIMLNSFSTV